MKTILLLIKILGSSTFFVIGMFYMFHAMALTTSANLGLFFVGVVMFIIGLACLFIRTG